MKKWIVASCLLWLVGVGFASEPKHYIHPETLEVAIVTAKYVKDMNHDGWEKMMSTSSVEFLKKACSVFSSYRPDKDIRTYNEVKKLSKADAWFCWKALHEYDIEDNEVYGILIFKTGIADDISITLVMTRITNQSESFSWRAVRLEYGFFKN